jgi:hypothetical protein
MIRTRSHTLWRNLSDAKVYRVDSNQSSGKYKRLNNSGEGARHRCGGAELSYPKCYALISAEKHVFTNRAGSALHENFVQIHGFRVGTHTEWITRINLI